MTPLEFLLARIRADEHVAHHDIAEAMVYESLAPGVTNGLTKRQLRVLADCEAKRRIVEMVRNTHIGYAAICVLASVYSDHPDFQEEWNRE